MKTAIPSTLYIDDLTCCTFYRIFAKIFGKILEDFMNLLATIRSSSGHNITLVKDEMRGVMVAQMRNPSDLTITQIAGTGFEEMQRYYVGREDQINWQAFSYQLIETSGKEYTLTL